MLFHTEGDGDPTREVTPGVGREGIKCRPVPGAGYGREKEPLLVGVTGECWRGRVSQGLGGS